MSANYARAFRLVRASIGCMQVDITDGLSISTSMLSLIEHGRRNPTSGVIAEFARATNVPVWVMAALASGENPPGLLKALFAAHL